MNFCSQCGGRLTLRIPPGDTHPRYVCDACQTIHYQNPKIVVGCIPEWEGKILLCRRAIEPRHGLWTIPAGFMENGETTLEAAARETLEEANARVDIGALYALYNLPHYDQIYLIFLARLTDPAFSPGEESLETQLFSPQDIPWNSIAFQAVRHSLQQFVADRGQGTFHFHMADIVPTEGDSHTVTVLHPLPSLC